MSRSDLVSLVFLFVAVFLMFVAGQTEGRFAVVALTNTATFSISIATVLWRRRNEN